MVPWENVQSSGDIDNYINSKLLPELYSKIDPESGSNNYLKDIDLQLEFQNNQQDPQIQQAFAIYKQDPEQAKKTILESINKQKMKVFNKWWNYITKENDIYQESPSFAYSVLKPMIDKSTDKDKRSTMPLNEMAVASLYDKIKSEGGQNAFRVDKQYEKEVNIVNQKTTESVKGTSSKDGNGWIRIPSQKNDPANFQANVDKLIGYSVPNGWCTGSGMATPYLSRGDFYLYVVNGKAEVAIRMDGNSLGEIQGERNQAPFSYTSEIEEFLNAKGIDPQNDYHYKELMEAKNLNEDLKDPEKYKLFLEKIQSDVSLVSRLSKENRENPQILQDILKSIDTGIRDVGLISTNYYGWMINDTVSYYSRLPNDIQSKLYPETRQYVINTVVNSIEDLSTKKNKSAIYSSIDRLPDSIAEDPAIKSKIFEVLTKDIEDHPWQIKQLSGDKSNLFPKEMIDRANRHPVSKMVDALETCGEDKNPEELIAEYWPKEIDESDYNYYNYQTYNFEKNEDYDLALKEWENQKKFLEENGFDDIRDIDVVYSALTDAWVRYIRKDPNRYVEAEGYQTEYTDWYEDGNDNAPFYNDRIREAADHAWYERVNEDPNNLDYLPEEFRYNYFEDEQDGRRGHYTQIWLEYFLKGNWDRMTDRSAEEAIESMDDNQLEQLANGILLSNIDIDVEELPVNLQRFLYNYEEVLKRREHEKSLKERGQQEFSFYEEVPTNEYRVNSLGQIEPVYNDEVQIDGVQASFKSWYRLAKSFQILKRHLLVN